MKPNIDLLELNEARREYLSSAKHQVLRHALSCTPLNNVVTSLDQSQDVPFLFNVDVKTMPVSNQLHSGRCWIFSASTVLREIIAKKVNVKDQFEISQNYISFFDKLEKYNYYMEHVIDLILKGEPHDSRRMHFLLAYGVSDGGQWDMYVNLVKKYGIVPKSAFPETEQSNNTMASTRLCNAALRKFSCDCYALVKEGKGKDTLEEVKGTYMKHVYDLLCDCFGVPPTHFDFEYTDKDDVVHCEKGLTPHAFFDKYIGEEIDEYVSLIHAPTPDKEYYQTYNVELVGNVIGGKPVTHLNLPMERIKELIIAQLKNNEIVWFGSDVSYYGKRNDGLWDDLAFDYVTPFEMELSYDKAAMLSSYHSAMNHAMVLTGVNLVDNKPNRWKVENSWGKDIGHDGYFIMSSSFFDTFVYQAAIKRKYLNEKELSALATTPVLLPPWDPFGTLAD